MRSISRFWMVVALLAGCALWVGCQPAAEKPGDGDAAESGNSGEAANGNDNGATMTDAAAQTVEPEEPPKPTMPVVELTEQLEDTCLVKVADAFPEGKLADVSGGEHALSDLRGEKLTVVYFWNSGDTPYAKMSAEDQLEYLGKDIAEPMADKGVKVVGINEGDSAENAKAPFDAVEVTFPNLVDPEGAFFGQVAKEKLPRVYLLDADGKILWFDVELSNSTRERLEQAIEVTLGQQE